MFFVGRAGAKLTPIMLGHFTPFVYLARMIGGQNYFFCEENQI